MSKINLQLPKKEIEKYFFQLCLAISKIKNIKEAAEFLRDLLTDQESEILARRLKIAELLIENQTYEEIRKQTKASPVTIAKIQEWLRISGEGYRMAIERTKDKLPKKRNEKINIIPFKSVKKIYPMYYWPEVLLENIIKKANKRDRENFQKIILEMKKIKKKSILRKKVEEILKKENKNKTK